MRHPWEKGEKVESGLDGDGEAANNVLGEKLRTGGDEAVHAGQRARSRLQAHQPRERVAARLRNTYNQNKFQICATVLRIRIRDQVPYWPLDPGSGIGFFRIPDRKPIFLSLMTIL